MCPAGYRGLGGGTPYNKNNLAGDKDLNKILGGTPKGQPHEQLQQQVKGGSAKRCHP